MVWFGLVWFDCELGKMVLVMKGITSRKVDVTFIVL